VVRATAARPQLVEPSNPKTVGVRDMSQLTELMDSRQLAERLRVPPSWVSNRTRERTPKDERIPCIKLGRYTRFSWPEVAEWLRSQNG
jgi:hypothetical protein